MTPLKTVKGATGMTGRFLGHSEREALSAIAVLTVEKSKPVAIEFRMFFSPHQIVSTFTEGPKPLGIGSTEWLAVGAGREGWRAADFWLDSAPFHRTCKHDEFPFYWGPFQVEPRNSLAAIALVTLLRGRWPDLPVSETSPTECYHHLIRSVHWPERAVRVQTLAGWLGLDLPVDLSEGEWEAAMAAYAMWMGLRGDWPIDLLRLTRPAKECWEITAKSEQMYWQPELSHRTLIFPAGPVSFFWPPDERAVVSPELSLHPRFVRIGETQMSNLNSTRKLEYIKQFDPNASVAAAEGGFYLESTIVIQKQKGIYKLRRQADDPDDAINQWWDRAVELRGDDELLKCGSLIGIFEYGDMAWRLIEGDDEEDWILSDYHEPTEAELDRMVRRQYRDPKWQKANEAHECEMSTLRHRRAVTEEAMRLLDEKEKLSKKGDFASGFAIGGIGAMVFEVWSAFKRRNHRRNGRG